MSLLQQCPLIALLFLAEASIVYLPPRISPSCSIAPSCQPPKHGAQTYRVVQVEQVAHVC